jgi:hypothetical protein
MPSCDGITPVLHDQVSPKNVRSVDIMVGRSEITRRFVRRLNAAPCCATSTSLHTAIERKAPHISERCSVSACQFKTALFHGNPTTL